MQIVYLTAGAAGMYCGSCLHDNAVAKALIAGGHDALLVPTYTPILTDEPSVARGQLFYGGLNVYLQQIFPLARLLPRWADRFLSSPKLVGWIASRSMGTTADKLGGLTVSMLQGKDGNQRKEVDRLVDWLASDIRPQAIIFSNLLIGGAIPEIRKRIGCPIVVILQGDDAFFDQLTEPFREQSMQLLRQLAKQVDLFLVHSRAYGERMQARLGLRPDQWQVTPLTLDTTDFVNFERAASVDRPPVIGYLARLAPEKGLHVLADAFIELAAKHPKVRLEIAGWLGPQHHDYWAQIQRRLADAGLTDRTRYWGSVDRAGKLEFLRSIDVLSVPVTHFEPKGLFVLEALAAGVPVVLPAHAAFPELVARLGGGHLVPLGDVHALAEQLASVVSDLPAARALGAAGRTEVLTHATSQQEAVRLVEILTGLLRGA
ncbi:MAG: glycosyltransferase family 4 protein [Pirellulaceae bacterium]|nr:glycosyltransferase family 4 protein [Pirellulaceae bacterium]